MRVTAVALTTFMCPLHHRRLCDKPNHSRHASAFTTRQRRRHTCTQLRHNTPALVQHAHVWCLNHRAIMLIALISS